MSSALESGPHAPCIHEEGTARIQEATRQTTAGLLAAAVTPAVSLHPASGADQHPGTHQGGGPHGSVRWPQHDGIPMRFLPAVGLSEVALFDQGPALPGRAG